MSRSRADLVRVIGGALSPGEAEVAAGLLGFERTSAAPPSSDSTQRVEDSTRKERDNPVVAPRVDGGLSTGFFRVERYEAVEPETDLQAVAFGETLRPEDLEDPDRSLDNTPPTPPIAPWSRIEPRLRALLGAVRAGRAPDVDAIVERLGRAEVLERVPLLPRRAWTEDLVVWLDRSPRHVVVADDQVRVLTRLLQLCGADALRYRIVASLERLGELARSTRAAAVLVLGDLGAGGSEREREAWRRAGEQLARRGLRAVALCPVGLDRLSPGILRSWSVAAWQVGAVALPADPLARRLECARRADRLLRLVSPAGLLLPGLLRALRTLLPASEADVGTEMDLLGRPVVRGFDASGISLRESELGALRESFFKQEAPELRAEVGRTLQRWHGELPMELLHTETVQWEGWSRQVCSELEPAPPGDLESALAFFHRVEGSLRVGVRQADLWRRYLRAALAGTPETAFKAGKAGFTLQLLWARAHAGRRVDLPAGLSLQALREVAGPEAPQQWVLRQLGSRLRLEDAAEVSDPATETLRWGSPTGTVLGASWILSGGRMRPLCVGEELELEPGASLEIETDRARLRVGFRQPPTWVVGVGRDRYGLWEEVEIEGVKVRFRWIPPGRFIMGSPADEQGRWTDEGPQHEVILSEGFWLGETPVTQALYQAVTRKNPSHFVSPDRPVEQVSWEEARTFCESLNERIPGFQARLPSEAEWEHACRAGTTGATWRGKLEIRGERDAPGLDEIAWYSGNSGVGFELENGYDSSDWPDKQHPHERAGTRPVAMKLANPWGLYDILGNVWEWCEDAWDLQRGYAPEVVIDPLQFEGSERVIRGGSWDGHGRFVRAAYRSGVSPGDRVDDLGFRLARGPALRGGAQERARSERRREGRPEQATTRPGRGRRG